MKLSSAIFSLGALIVFPACGKKNDSKANKKQNPLFGRYLVSHNIEQNTEKRAELEIGEGFVEMQSIVVRDGKELCRAIARSNDVKISDSKIIVSTTDKKSIEGEDFHCGAKVGGTWGYRLDDQGRLFLKNDKNVEFNPISKIK